MPRKGRLDYPGALQHVMVRGLERRRIFRETQDYKDFKDRLGQAVHSAEARCFAWALMPNHVHLLLQTGSEPLSKLMQRVLTGYGHAFNRRHHRVGYVYEGRFKSLLCEEEPYFLELLRYIHLNPLKARIVGSMRDLDGYAWCGHAVILGRKKAPWQEVRGVLERFSRRPSKARQEYRKFIGVFDKSILSYQEMLNQVESITESKVVEEKVE